MCLQVDVLSRVRHKNLVALVGYCQEDKKQILIYEYMHNGSLHDELRGNRSFLRVSILVPTESQMLKLEYFKFWMCFPILDMNLVSLVGSPTMHHYIR